MFNLLKKKCPFNNYFGLSCYYGENDVIDDRWLDQAKSMIEEERSRRKQEIIDEGSHILDFLRRCKEDNLTVIQTDLIWQHLAYRDFIDWAYDNKVYTSRVFDVWTRRERGYVIHKIPKLVNNRLVFDKESAVDFLEHTGLIFAFQKESDAVAFKLKWT